MQGFIKVGGSGFKQLALLATGLLSNGILLDNVNLLETEGISSGTTSSIFLGCNTLAKRAGVIDVAGRFCPALATGLVNVKSVTLKLLLLAAGLFSNRTSLTPEVDGIFSHALYSNFFGFSTWTEGAGAVEADKRF